MKEEYDFSQGKRGAINPIPPGKTRVTTVLDDDILEWFRSQVHTAGGGNYQTLINEVLREYIQRRQEFIEAGEKNNKDLDEVLEILESITKIKARSLKERGLRNMQASRTWGKVLFFELGFLVSFTVSILLLKDFEAISLVFAFLAFILFFIFFILFLNLMFREFKESSQLTHKEFVQNFALNNLDQENINIISEKFSISILKRATKDVEISLKNFQARRKSMDALLPIYITGCVAVLVPVFGGESLQKFLEGKILYGIVTGASGIIALLILISKFVLALDEESKTNIYNEWLFILKEAQDIDQGKTT